MSPNLEGADLSDTDLSDANLCHANLYAAVMRGSDLSSANLTYACLRLANLRDAVLPNAQMQDALLAGAVLRGANLSGADLSGAELADADLSEADVGGTGFSDTDLSRVRGLASVRHNSRSTISIDTIYLSQGKIPESFLRGAGVPEGFITYVKSLTGAAFDFYSCFISYSSTDQIFAERLHADLQAKGVRCWFAPEDLKIGERFRSRIDESIRIQDKLLLVLSKDSIRSPWVEKEVETAFERERREDRIVLFPIRLDDAAMSTNEAWTADIRRTRHIGDFNGWHQHGKYIKAFERLLRDLKVHPSAKADVQPAR
jgi:uncharacterized protein YjbI with pentapeptide repeats